MPQPQPSVPKTVQAGASCQSYAHGAVPGTCSGRRSQSQHPLLRRPSLLRLPSHHLPLSLPPCSSRWGHLETTRLPSLTVGLVAFASGGAINSSTRVHVSTKPVDGDGSHMSSKKMCCFHVDVAFAVLSRFTLCADRRDNPAIRWACPRPDSSSLAGVNKQKEMCQPSYSRPVGRQSQTLVHRHKFLFLDRVAKPPTSRPSTTR